jgi:hypothetical protein
MKINFGGKDSRFSSFAKDLTRKIARFSTKKRSYRIKTSALHYISVAQSATQAGSDDRTNFGSLFAPQNVFRRFLVPTATRRQYFSVLLRRDAVLPRKREFWRVARTFLALKTCARG